MTKKIGIALILLAVLTLMAGQQVMAKGKLDIVKKFLNGGKELDVATYTDGDKKIALLGIAASQRISFAFGSDDWTKFEELWTKARGGANGAMTEVGTTNPCNLKLTVAGDSIKITIHDPAKNGTNDYVLPKKDYAGFEAATKKVTDYLGE